MALYLIHFLQPFGHARHYLGWVADEADIPRRLEQHRGGRGGGARLTEAAVRAGVGMVLARVWPDGDRNAERRKKINGHSRRCPICKEQGR